MNDTIADLAATGRLEGRRVMLLEDVGSFVRKGAIGEVRSVASSEPKATVHYVMPDRCGPWSTCTVESLLCKLLLLEEIAP